MNTVLYNTGILSMIIGLLLYLIRRQRSGEVEVKGFHIKGREGFILIIFGLLQMAAASWT